MSIEKVIESVNRLHGSIRQQEQKHASYLAWQLRQRAEQEGREPSILLKKESRDA